MNNARLNVLWWTRGRRAVAALLVVSAVAGLAWLLARDPHPGAIKHVLLITLDTTRADHLGCYGFENALTPALDRLAAQGTLFEQCRTVAPLTLPSHATILTGLRPPEHGLRLNGRGRLPANIPTLATELAQLGLTNAAFVASPVLASRYGLARGFAHYDDRLPEHEAGKPKPGPFDVEHYYRPGDQVVSAALAWLEANGDTPFFCWVHLFDPHEPYSSHPGRFRQTFPHPYDAEIAFMDQQVGRLLAWLKGAGVEDQTLVVVVGDHGEDLHQHGEPTHSLTLYDTTLHVPLIVRAPGVVRPGQRVPAAVEVTDVYATVLDMMSGAVPPAGGARGSGRSLRVALEGGMLESGVCYAETDEPYAEYGWAPLRSIVVDGWKYIHSPIAELYNVAADPGETTSLATEHPEKLEALRGQLAALRHGMVVGPSEGVTLSADDQRRLRSLGYMAGGGESREALLDAVDRSDWGGLRDIKTMLPLYEEGWALLNQVERAGDTSDELLARCLKLARRSPETARFHRLVGTLYVGRGQLAEGADAYRKAIEIDPTDLETLSKLGVALCRHGQIDEGVARLREAVALEPRHAEVRNNLGYALLLQERADDASVHLREAARLDPTYTEAFMNLAAAYAAQGRFVEAVDAGTRATNLALAEANRNLAALLGTRVASYRAALKRAEGETADHGNGLR